MADLIEQDERFLAQFMRHEGARKKRGRHVAYRCPAGAMTIGYGHNLDANPIPGLGENSSITEGRVREILMSDLATFAAGLDREIPWWRRLDAPRQAVLLNMAFNMGEAGLMTFQRTLQAVREMRWTDARNGMLASKWAGQVGRRAVELARQMMTGEWQEGAGRALPRSASEAGTPLPASESECPAGRGAERHGEETVMLFGVVPVSPLSDTGAPWMLATETWDKALDAGLNLTFARRCRSYLADMGRGFACLENHVHADNRKAIRWLAWLGFRFDPPAPFGVRGEMFMRFWMEVR